VKPLVTLVMSFVAAGLIAAPGRAADWTPLPPLPGGPFVVLADGGIVAGSLTAITPVLATVESPTLGRLDLAREAVRGYRAGTAIGPPAPAGDASAATIALVNGDVATATALDMRDGVLRFTMTDPASPQPVAISVPFDRVRAIDFGVPASPAARRRTLVALADGSRFATTSIPKECDPVDVVATVSDGDHVRLLDALEPAAHEPPTSGDAWPLTRGATLTGAWPAARGMTAFGAIGIHAPARVRYRLERPARGFATRVAIDDTTGTGGSAVVRIRARTGDAAFREVAASPVIRGGQEPVSLEADLGGATELELLVDPADVGTVLDRTIWLDPRVTW